MARSGKGESLLFGVVDAARDPRLYDLAKSASETACLFAGNLAEPLARAAPYLCVLGPDDALFRTWRDEGWGQSWGITFRSAAGMTDLWKQLRRNLQAMLPDGAITLFRFYDPRVWRVYLPTCSPNELASWFGPIEEYQCENADGTGSVRYRLGQGGLEVQG